MTDFRFRPIGTWPAVLRAEDERESPWFSATYTETLDLLDRELWHLDAERIVIQLDLSNRDIRLDGLPRAGARPGHPGVIVSFDSKHGPLRYLTDVFTSGTVWRSGRGGSTHVPGWQANLRAIALGLEALRKVDRYGITKRGEQYRGFAELPAGIPMSGPSHMTTEEAAKLIAKWGGGGWADVLASPEQFARSYRRAAKELHPDSPSGSTDLFQQLQQAKALLDREAGRG